MQQALGGYLKLADRFAKLIFNGFRRQMQTFGNFFNRQSGFAAIQENQPAAVGQPLHFLLYPFQYLFIMQAGFSMVFRDLDLRLQHFQVFTLPYIPFNPVQHRIFYRHGQVIFGGVDLLCMPVRPDAGKHIMHYIFSGGCIPETVKSYDE